MNIRRWLAVPNRVISRCLAVAAVALTFGTGARATMDVPGVAVTQAPKIDGEISGGEWPAEATGSGFFDIGSGQASGVQGSFWIAYDSQFVYFAARAGAPRGDVKANEYKPNSSLGGDDSFHLLIDGLATSAQFDIFSINAIGTNQVRLAGGRAAKTEWLGEFESAGKIFDDRWECEARIPWSLVTRPAPGKRNLKLNVLWYQSKAQREYEWTYIAGDFTKFGSWRDVDVPAVKTARELKLLPYIYAGVDHEGDHVTDAGLDLKYQLTDSLNLVGAVNPDFRNIENQILSLDFSYLERLAGESRPFFLEGIEYRRTGGGHTLFASQRLQQFDFGINSYGNLNDRTQLSLMSTMDFGEESATVASVRVRPSSTTDSVFSYVGWDKPGFDNQAGMFRLTKRMGAYTVSTLNQFTDDEIRGRGTRNLVEFIRQGGGDVMGITYQQVTSNFFPRIGFSPERDLKGYSAFWERSTPYQTGPLSESGFVISRNDYDRYEGGHYRESLYLGPRVTLRNQLTVAFDAFYEKFLEFDDEIYAIILMQPQNDPNRRWHLDYTWGERRGHKYVNALANFQYRPVKRLQLGLSAQTVRHFETNDQVIFSFNYDVTARESLGGRLVQTDGNTNWYASYKMSGGRGNEFFLILGDPNAETFRRNIILKAVFPVSVKF